MHRLRTLAVLLLGLAGALPLAAQGPSATESLREPVPPRHDVSTLEGAGVTAGIAALFLIDRPTRDFLQAHRSRTLDGIAGVFRTMGTAPVYAGVAVGVTGVGLIAGDPEVERAGGRLLLSEVVTIAADELVKKLVGRARPDVSPSSYDFDPFRNKQVSFVSGHSAMAFVLATSLADDLHSTWSSSPSTPSRPGLPGPGSTTTALAERRRRGAALGFTVSKMMSNRWEVLDINPPGFLTEK
jgi:PAP2 superfamily.